MSALTKTYPVGTITVWFSYSTPVAFQTDGDPTVVSQNVWSPTTARHIKMIEPDADNHVPHDQFVLLYDSALAKAIREKEVG